MLKESVVHSAQRNRGSWRLWHLEYVRGEPGERDFLRTEGTKIRSQEIKTFTSLLPPLCPFSVSPQPAPFYSLPNNPSLSMNKYRLDTYSLLCTWLSLPYALELSPLGLEATVALHSRTLPCGCAISSPTMSSWVLSTLLPWERCCDG